MVVYKENGDIFGISRDTGTSPMSEVLLISLYIEDVEAFADFTIAYTPFQSAAGCINNDRSQHITH